MSGKFLRSLVLGGTSHFNWLYFKNPTTFLSEDQQRYPHGSGMQKEKVINVAQLRTCSLKKEILRGNFLTDLYPSQQKGLLPTPSPSSFSVYIKGWGLGNTWTTGIKVSRKWNTARKEVLDWEEKLQHWRNMLKIIAPIYRLIKRLRFNLKNNGLSPPDTHKTHTYTHTQNYHTNKL